MRINDLARAVRDLVYPSLCAGCGQPASEGLCPECVALFEPLPAPRCAQCGTPIRDADPAAVRCPRCVGSRPFDRARELYRYDGVLRDAVRAWKFGGRHELGHAFGEILARAIRSAMEGPTSPLAGLPFGQADLICVVPLWPSRERERGANQATDLAGPIAAALERPLDTGLLHRTRETRPQPGLTPSERLANVDGAFRAVPGRHPVRRARVLVVDDLITTGATMAACATALRAAGAARVWAVALAHPMTLGDHDP